MPYATPDATSLSHFVLDGLARRLRCLCPLCLYSRPRYCYLFQRYPGIPNGRPYLRHCPSHRLPPLYHYWRNLDTSPAAWHMGWTAKSAECTLRSDCSWSDGEYYRPLDDGSQGCAQSVGGRYRRHLLCAW